MKVRILFLCTANSCRSQMAEGIANHLLGDRVEAWSAGTRSTFVHPRAIAAMEEIGIDISSHRSKVVDEFEGQRFDYVITLCSSARDNCPIYPGASRTVHLGFDDPAAVLGTDEEIMAGFRRIRDEIRERLTSFFAMEAITTNEGWNDNDI